MCYGCASAWDSASDHHEEAVIIKDATSLLAAVASTLSAIFAAFAFYYSRRRDRQTWVRTALESAFVDFLTASHDMREACKHIARLGLGGSSRKSAETWFEIANQAHDTMMKAVTRFRVLASNRTADTALELHEHNDLDLKFLKEGKFQEFLDTRDSRSKSFYADRDRFLDEAQQVLELHPRWLRRVRVLRSRLRRSSKTVRQLA